MRPSPTLEWVSVPAHIAEGPAQVLHKDGWLVCEVSADSYARLIAAAPDLLAVALAQEALMSTPGDPSENIQQVIKMRRAALAKAGA